MNSDEERRFMYKINQGHLTVFCIVFVWLGGPPSPVRIITQVPWFMYQSRLGPFDGVYYLHKRKRMLWLHPNIQQKKCVMTNNLDQSFSKKCGEITSPPLPPLYLRPWLVTLSQLCANNKQKKRSSLKCIWPKGFRKEGIIESFLIWSFQLRVEIF